MREERVHKLAEHLVAEIESIAHLETKGLKPEKVDGGQPVMKKMEENGKGDSKGEVEDLLRNHHPAGSSPWSLDARRASSVGHVLRPEV